MKIKNLLLLLFGFSVWSCSVEKEAVQPEPLPAVPQVQITCLPFYYYDINGIKQVPAYADSLVFIGFNTSSPAQQAAIVSGFEFLKPLDSLVQQGNMFFVKFTQPQSCTNFKARIQELKQHPKIAFASPVFSNLQWSYATEAVVKLKQANQYPLLKQIALAEQCTIDSTFGGNIYVLVLQKTAPKDALDLANYLHETGSFEWAEINRYHFNIFPGIVSGTVRPDYSLK